MHLGSVLVVEDDGDLAVALGDLLADLGYFVCALADTGEKALGLAGDAKPDVALMDIQLAGELDGISTARELRLRFRLPVIFLTAHADARTLARAGEAAAFGYLVKPCEALELRAAIETAMVRAKLELERDRLIVELQEATAKVRVLRGLLPICARCKKIRNDRGYWVLLEEYIQNNSEATFTHGVCTECVKALYPEYVGHLCGGEGHGHGH